MPQSQTAALSSSRPNLLENLHESDIYENYVRARYGRNNLVLDNDSSPCKHLLFVLLLVQSQLTSPDPLVSSSSP